MSIETVPVISKRLWQQRRPLLVFLVYVALTIVMTWPIAGRLGEHIPGSSGDAWSHLWTFRWVKQSLLAGENPFYTDLLYYPDGVSLFFHNIAWVNIAFWLPFQAVIGEAAAYSVVFLGVFVLNGFATYLLARELTASEVAAFVAGLVVAFWPYILSHHDHPNLIFIAWIPLALLFLIRLLDHGRVRDAVLAALFIALIGLTRWQLLIVGGFILALIVIYRFAIDKSVRSRSMVVLLIVMGLLAVIIMSPLLVPVVSAQLTLADPEVLFVDEEPASTDLLAYFAPSRYHPFWGDSAFQLLGNFGVNKVFVPFIGFTVLALSIYGTVVAWPRSRPWLLAIILYILLALGTTLTINGIQVPAPMPYGLVEDQFIIRLIRSPDRLNIVLGIPFAILTAYGIAALMNSKLSKNLTFAIAGLITLAILGEFAVKYPTLTLTVPGWYGDLALESGEFGILGVPMEQRGLTDKAYMYYQSVHGKPIVGGHVSRPPSEAIRFIQNVPLLQMLSQGLRTPPEELDAFEQIAQLSGANIRYLIFHKDFLSENKIALWQDWLIQKPVYEDSQLVVFRTDPVLGRDFAVRNVLTLNEAGEAELGLLRAWIDTPELEVGDELEVNANWMAISSPERDYDACVMLFDQDGALTQSECLPFVDGMPTSQWLAGDTALSTHVFEIDPYLDSGVYDIRLGLSTDESSDSDSTVAEVGTVVFSSFEREFDQPELPYEKLVSWGDQISMLGFDVPAVDESDETVRITIFWQALRRMDASYAAFLHLENPATGEVVSQADVIPRGWSYPTVWWESGEVVEDAIQLSLKDVPPGEYQLFLGWYNMETGERLGATSETGETYAEDRVPITSVTR